MVVSAEVIPINIEDEMRSSYLDYSMSVIIGRALPDVRDGLKPVHRRILYAMFREGLLSNKRYSKCAGVVGEVLKKYHPHGDMAVYDTLVRMAQEWNMRYPLIDGQGNFGCFTGDTRVRLTNGASKSFLELVADESKGVTHFTYTIKADNGIAMAPIRAPRLTKKNAPTVKVTLDNGEEIRCTPDHRFMLRNGEYCEAQHLEAGTSLMPFYSRLNAGNDKDLQGYEEVHNPANDSWVFAHRLADQMSHSEPKAKNLPLRSFAALRMTKCSVRECHERLNHKVLSVIPAGHADVYDLTVDGTHNFALASGVFVHNSVDGDSAAAYRYTEAKLMKLAEELLADIDKETVDFTANFDDSTVEPLVLPTRVPNLLVNGSDGIAVGMATKIPPHNLGEIIDGTIATIENPDITIPQLMKHIPGPDFPTGASIYGGAGIKSAYETGRGIIQMRAKAMIETIARGDRESIVITEIPFQVNKAKLIEHIATLVQDGKIEGISDLRDESDRDGMRIVVELKRGAVAGVILNQLYKYTAMQSSFGVIMLSIVGGQPKILTLKAMIERFVDHRREVVIRRTAFDLRKAEERAHILEGLKIAVENIDDVVALIKKSKSPDEARAGLVKKYSLSSIQAQAILDLRLQRLTGLERDKIIQEYKDIQLLIRDLKDILGNEKRVTRIISDELKEIRAKYADARRTEIIAQQADDLSVEDLIQEEDMVVTISHNGYIKRNPISIYRAQRRGGRGKTGMSTGEEDFVSSLFIATTHCTMLVFSTIGKVYWLKVHEIPQIGRTAKGKAISNLINMPNTESIAAFMTIREFTEGQNIVMATQMGVVKKTELMEYSRPRAGGIIGITLDEGDAIVSVRLTDGKEDILLSTRQGQAIRFKEEEARPIGRVSRGVRGITLEKGDAVVSMETLSQKCNILSVTQNGYGKRTDSDEYRVQGRGGTGIITIKTNDRNGPVVGTMVASDTDDIMIVTDGGKVIRQHAKDISVIGRNTQGVRLINLETGEHVVSFAKLVENDEEEASVSS